MRIKQVILEEINKGDKANTIKAELIKANDKHPGTIQRWIDNNDEVLTTAKNIGVISRELDLTSEEIMEEEKTAA